MSESQTLSSPTQASSLSDWLTYMHQIHVSAIDMGLSRVLPVAEKLGVLSVNDKSDTQPQTKPYIFTVAGTNGKGSTTAIISEICQQAGYKTALYQSPHLLEFNERVRISGNPVSNQTLIDAFYQVEQARLACDLTLSFFEMTTLSAMLIFTQADCDVWVLEVGLGGRLDVVNIIDPDMAVITNIGIDHVDWLGDTREKIGYEKAGILRQGIPVVYGEEDMPVSVQNKIKKLDCITYQVGKDFACFDDGSDPQVWQFSSRAVTLNLPKPTLSLINSANAVATVLASELSINQNDIANGLRAVKLAGRFDYRQLANRHWLFDVAHNAEGVNFLLQGFVPFWQRHLASHPTAKLHLLFSMLGDKNVKAVVSLLQRSNLPIESWYLAEINHPRAMPLQELESSLATMVDTNQVNAHDSFNNAVVRMIQQTNPADFILVCGSFHTIGEVLTVLQS